MESISKDELAAAIEKNRGRMKARAYSILQNDADADDAVGDATVKAFEHRGQLREKGAAAGWIMKILVNASKNIIQKNARMELRAEIGEDALDASFAREMNGLNGTVEDAPANVADTETMRRALYALRAEYRICVVLHYLFGYSVRDIAGMLEISENAVKMRLFHGRKQLAALLKDAVLMIAFCFTLSGWLLAGRFAGEATMPRDGCGNVVLSGEMDDAFGLENAETDDLQNVDGRNDAAGSSVDGNAGDGESDDIGGTIDATPNATNDVLIDATPDATSDARVDTTTDATSNTATDKSNISSEPTDDATKTTANNSSLWFSRSLSKSEQRRLRVLSAIGVDANDEAANAVVVISNTSEIDANAVCYLAAKNRVYLPTRTLTDDELKQILILTGETESSTGGNGANSTSGKTTGDDVDDDADKTGKNGADDDTSKTGSDSTDEVSGEMAGNDDVTNALATVIAGKQTLRETTYVLPPRVEPVTDYEVGEIVPVSDAYAALYDDEPTVEEVDALAEQVAELDAKFAAERQKERERLNAETESTADDGSERPRGLFTRSNTLGLLEWAGDNVGVVVAVQENGGSINPFTGLPSKQLYVMTLAEMKERLAELQNEAADETENAVENLAGNGGDETDMAETQTNADATTASDALSENTKPVTTECATDCTETEFQGGNANDNYQSNGTSVSRTDEAERADREPGGRMEGGAAAGLGTGRGNQGETESVDGDTGV